MSESDDFQARLLNMKDVGDTRDFDIGYENGRWWARRKATARDLAALEAMRRNGDGEYHVAEMYEALFPEGHDAGVREEIEDYLADLVMMGPDNGWEDGFIGGASFAMVKGFLEGVSHVKAEAERNADH
jgi:hypothetical protein